MKFILKLPKEQAAARCKQWEDTSPPFEVMKSTAALRQQKSKSKDFAVVSDDLPGSSVAQSIAL